MVLDAANVRLIAPAAAGGSTAPVAITTTITAITVTTALVRPVVFV